MWFWGSPIKNGEWTWDWNYSLQRARAHACTPIVQATLESFREHHSDPSHIFRNGFQARLLDIAVLNGDAMSVQALVHLCGTGRVLRLWTWCDLVEENQEGKWPGMFATVTGGIGPAQDVALCTCNRRLTEPKILEAAVLAGLDFSSLNGASAMNPESINVLDVAILSGEREVVNVLHHSGMKPDFFCFPCPSELNIAGMHFMELTEQGMLTLRMPSIRAAADVVSPYPNSATIAPLVDAILAVHSAQEL